MKALKILLITTTLFLLVGCSEKVAYTSKNLDKDFLACELTCKFEMDKWGEEYVRACTYGCGEMAGNLLEKMDDNNYEMEIIINDDLSELESLNVTYKKTNK